MGVRNLGIQPGQVAASPGSKLLEGTTRSVTESIVKKWREVYPRLSWVKGLSASELLENIRLDIDPEDFDINGVFPDGGIVFYDDPHQGRVPLFASEAKFQGNTGNAIERWFKNYTALMSLNPDISYVTFCSGAGAARGGVIRRTINHSLTSHAVVHRLRAPRRANHLYNQGPSVFYRQGGFSALRMEIILSALLSRRVKDLSRT